MLPSHSPSSSPSSPPRSPKRRKQDMHHQHQHLHHKPHPAPLDVLADLPVCVAAAFSQLDRAVPPSDAFPVYLPTPADAAPARCIALETRRVLIRALLARPASHTVPTTTSHQRHPHRPHHHHHHQQHHQQHQQQQQQHQQQQPRTPQQQTQQLANPNKRPFSAINTHPQTPTAIVANNPPTPSATAPDAAALDPTPDRPRQRRATHARPPPGTPSSARPSASTPASTPSTPTPASASGAGAHAAAPLADPKARPRWTSLDRERKQACLRVALSAACRASPPGSAAPLHRLRDGWARNPRMRQLVDLRVRRLLADSAPHWSLAELREYLTRAGVGRVAAATRAELETAVVAHLAPEVAAARAARS